MLSPSLYFLFMNSTPFNKGLSYKLPTTKIKNWLLFYALGQQVYDSIYCLTDSQKEVEFYTWIQELTGLSSSPNLKSLEGLKNGIILSRLINKLQLGSFFKFSCSMQNWYQLENLFTFIKALNLLTSFEASDLFESWNMTMGAGVSSCSGNEGLEKESAEWHGHRC